MIGVVVKALMQSGPVGAFASFRGHRLLLKRSGGKDDDLFGFAAYAGLGVESGQFGAGGGLIKPMQARWEMWLNRAEVEAPKVKQQAQQAPSVAEQAKQATQQAKVASKPAAERRA